MTSISVPPRWRQQSDPAQGILVAAWPGQPSPSGVHPQLVLRSSTADRDLLAWRSDALAELAQRLEGFDLEDSDEFELEGREVSYARYAHRDGADELVSDQWAWLAGGVGTTLTCTVAREDYAEWCDVFEAVAATVDPAA